MPAVVNWDRLQNDIIDAAVRAVNATLFVGEERALHDVPVRSVFKGGRATIRFKTAAEIEKDKDLRQRLGLAPEILATPELVAQVKARGLNPKKSHIIGGKEFGFARTISHPARDNRRNKAGLTRAERGLVENRRNKANTFIPFGEDIRLTDTKRMDQNRLLNPHAEKFLSGRGRNELKSGRAIRDKTKAFVDIGTGRIFFKQTEQERLGGGLKASIRIEKASAETYPDIEGRLIAGDSEHKYAIYQELGTRHNKAHPFLRPRLPEWREELPAQLLRSLRRTGR